MLNSVTLAAHITTTSPPPVPAPFKAGCVDADVGGVAGDVDEEDNWQIFRYVCV